ncbi:MAG: hypothetical protein RBR67_18520 [Desulfobacterium sp.]|jgi:hypothetical protein|nr:hypothetical protein [Desulfobacterium sp.]
MRKSYSGNLKAKMAIAGYNVFGGGYLKPFIEAEAKRFCSQFS